MSHPSHCATATLYPMIRFATHIKNRNHPHSGVIHDINVRIQKNTWMGDEVFAAWFRNL